MGNTRQSHEGQSARLESGSSTEPGNRTEPLPNDYLTLRVQEAFATDTALQYAPIGVETFTGIVQLSGQVARRYQMLRAAELASQISGVRGVRNLMELAPQRIAASDS